MLIAWTDIDGRSTGGNASQEQTCVVMTHFDEQEIENCLFDIDKCVQLEHLRHLICL
jgi:hypothetical protein